MIAASAIIPIFYFPGWEYCNLDEVLLYPDAFDENFRQEGTERKHAGVVGDGSFQRDDTLKACTAGRFFQ